MRGSNAFDPAAETRSRSFRQDRTSRLDDLIYRLRARSALRAFPLHAGVVADVGSGYDARFLRTALGNGRIDQGIAIDISLESLNRGESIAHVEANVCESLPIDDSSVDVATSLAVLEHLPDPSVYVSEIHRILRPGGIAILTTPTVRSKPILELLAFRLRLIDAAEIRDHKHYYTKSELRGLLARAGFPEETIVCRQFELGMNSLVIARKATNSSVSRTRRAAEEQGE